MPESCAVEVDDVDQRFLVACEANQQIADREIPVADARVVKAPGQAAEGGQKVGLVDLRKELGFASGMQGAKEVASLEAIGEPLTDIERRTFAVGRFDERDRRGRRYAGRQNRRGSTPALLGLAAAEPALQPPVPALIPKLLDHDLAPTVAGVGLDRIEVVPAPMQRFGGFRRIGQPRDFGFEIGRIEARSDLARESRNGEPPRARRCRPGAHTSVIWYLS